MTNIRNLLLVLLTTFMLMIIWAAATNPRLVERLISNRCVERFSELRKAPNRQIVGPPSSRVLKSGFSSAVYPIGQSTESVLLEALQAHDISVDENLNFQVFDSGHITVQTYNERGMQIGSYDFDYCGRMF